MDTKTNMKSTFISVGVIASVLVIFFGTLYLLPRSESFTEEARAEMAQLDKHLFDLGTIIRDASEQKKNYEDRMQELEKSIQDKRAVAESQDVKK